VTASSDPALQFRDQQLSGFAATVLGRTPQHRCTSVRVTGLSELAGDPQGLAP